MLIPSIFVRIQYRRKPKGVFIMTDYYKILGVSEDADEAVKADLFLKF